MYEKILKIQVDFQAAAVKAVRKELLQYKMALSDLIESINRG